MYPLYNDNSGCCKVCDADTLWGDAPHTESCELAEILALLKERVHRVAAVCARSTADWTTLLATLDLPMEFPGDTEIRALYRQIEDLKEKLHEASPASSHR